MLRQADRDSFTLPFALRGPGNEAGPDWVVIFEVDQQESTGAAKKRRWLVIQGQTEKRDALGTTGVRPLESWAEVQKQYPLDEHTATLFLVVTDGKAPVVWDQPDVLCIGQEQHVAFYGPIGSLRRQAIAYATFCS